MDYHPGPPIRYIAAMEYEDLNNEKLGLRDLLALDRTILANERTMLAYARTSVMLLVSAITLLKVFPENDYARLVGVCLIPTAVLTAVIGLRRYFQLSRALAKRRQN